MERFARNLPSLSESEQALLKTKCALIVGCGGIGGYLSEYLVRLGVGALTLCDGDSFEESNLNRQLLSLEENLGESKARAAEKRARAISAEVSLRTWDEFFTGENADLVMEGADIVLDALDSVSARLLLEEKCGEKGLTLIHGAVRGWNAQISVVPPGSGAIRRLYAGAKENKDISCLSFVPAFCAAVQAAEAAKLLCGRPSSLRGRLLAADLLNGEFETFEL